MDANGKPKHVPVARPKVSEAESAAEPTTGVKTENTEIQAVEDAVNGELPPRNPRKRQREESPSPEEKAMKRMRTDPFMFLYGHKNIIVLGEEDFSISYE